MEPIAVKKYKTFKEYYQDEEFRNRQKKYLAEKIVCVCGAKISRSNAASHRKTTIHKRRLERLSKTTELEEKRAKTVTRIEKLEAEIISIDKSIARIKKKNNDYANADEN
jgi:hypothetical protein